MIGIPIKFSELQVGDAFSADFTSGIEVLTSPPTFESAFDEQFWWETNKHHGDSKWWSQRRVLDVMVTLHASSASALGDRIVTCLEGFSPEVRRLIGRRLCAECGSIDCKQHR